MRYGVRGLWTRDGLGAERSGVGGVSVAERSVRCGAECSVSAGFRPRATGWGGV